MITNIMDAISKQLYDIFGEGYRIYQDDVEQSLQEPCFIITGIDPSRTELLGTRSRMKIPISIVYIPKSNCYDVHHKAETMFDNFDMLETADGDNKFIGRDMRSEVVDKQLYFFVSYNYVRDVVKNETYMDEIQIERGY